MAACLQCSAYRAGILCEVCEVAAFCSEECRAAAAEDHEEFCLADGVFPTARSIVDHALETLRRWDEPLDDNGLQKGLKREARVQAQVLAKLGFCSSGFVLGQSALWPDTAVAMLQDPAGSGGAARTLAARLCGRNSFEWHWLPVIRALAEGQLWPTVMVDQPQAVFFGLPTLELCAALVTRILCVAGRLAARGTRRLLVLGIGSGDALLEASVALHLGKALGQPACLDNRHPRFDYLGVEIEVAATDTPDIWLRKQSHTADVRAQMFVQPADVEEAVKEQVDKGTNMFVLCAFPPPGARWAELVCTVGGEHVWEMCFVMEPHTMVGLSDEDLESLPLRMTEHFPKTVCKEDFPTRDFKVDSEEAGLFHAQLYIFSQRDAPRPCLSPTICHELGPYDLRLQSDRDLQGVHVFRSLGLWYACCPGHLREPLPRESYDALRSQLERGDGELTALVADLEGAEGFASGSASTELRQLADGALARASSLAISDVAAGGEGAMAVGHSIDSLARCNALLDSLGME